MKRVILYIVAAVVLPLSSWARIPDEEDILRKIIDRSSPYYYTSLFMRYNAAERLSEDDYHYLYYGYAYNEGYKPFAANPALDELYATMTTIDMQHPRKDDLEHIITKCRQAMLIDPFNPMVLNMLVFAYGHRGDKKMEEAYFRHLNGILETIKSSGDGRTDKYPMHIIMFSHALELMASMDLECREAQIVSRTCEYIPLVKPRRVPDGRIKGFYFDYSRIYRNKPEDVTFKKKRTWQFNNLGVREYR
jgi:hypothetical protein